MGVGFNRMDKTHPTMQRNNPDKTWTPGLHAEVHACLGVELNLLHGATIYVARLRKARAHHKAANGARGAWNECR